MNRQPAIKFLFSFFLVIAASFGNKAVSVVPVSVPGAFKSETVSNKEQKNPHTELEGTYLHLTSIGHTVIQKTVTPFCSLPDAVFYSANNSLENFQIRKLSLLPKDHLSYNYPSHNFW